jgi:hypothetical protein
LGSVLGAERANDRELRRALEGAVH